VTFERVDHAIHNGPDRGYGREWMQTYLRETEGLGLPENDIREAITAINPEGTH
jgi:hypothetical protein